MNGGSRSSRGFWALWVTQFQGAFSDNVYKNLVTFLILALTMPVAQKDGLILWVGILFAAPFILFSMAGGWLATRFSKRTVTVGVKLLEVAVMTLATVGLAWENLPALLICVFLMSVQSALFGPSKYGLLPELLSEPDLSWGNGVLQMGTNVAILLGTVASGWLADVFVGRQQWSGVVLVGLALLGTASSLGIPRLTAANPAARFRVNFLGDLWSQLSYVRTDRRLALALLGNTYFSFLGSWMLINVTMYGQEILGLAFRHNALLQTALAVGIGAGALAAGYLSGRKIEYGLVPLGALGITVMATLLGRTGLTAWEFAAHLVALGFFGGFFIVPISALLQHRPERARKAGVLGAANLLSFSGVLLGFVVNYALRQLGLNPVSMFWAGAAVTLVATGVAVWVLPDALLRTLVWLFTHSVYRVRVQGREHVPETGGALLVCNHVSFVDALLVIASTDRTIRAVMFKDIYYRWYVWPFARAMQAIPISSQQRPRELLASLRRASQMIQEGHVVCIFAEGQITRIGQLLPFRRGMSVIMKGVSAPIIPVALDNVWGSIFSYEAGRIFGKIPRYFPYPVTVSYGKPLPATASPRDVRRAVQELNSTAWQNRRQHLLPLAVALIRNAHRHPFLFAMADQRVPRLSFGAALLKTLFLAHRLRSVWRDQPMVGILLPPSVGGALVNHAALLLGKVPVNLNYTANAAVLKACATQCRLQTVITSRAFLEKVPCEVPARAVFLEDLAANPRLGEKLLALAMWPIPAPWLAWWLARRSPLLVPNAACEPVAVPRGRADPFDALLTVIFSSGSTGEPKGIMLTQFNVAANVEQCGEVFAFRHHDKILGILPFFHSFGFTVTLMLPIRFGVGVVFHPNPMDGRAVGELVAKYAVTFLMATPTFLQIYRRTCAPEQFGSLQYVVAGAEKLPDRLALAFEEQFGIRPLEGYGATECAPVVSVNTRDFRGPGIRQVGAKLGTIGLPLPGISVKIVDPDTWEPVPQGSAGLLLVRGPNVMAGYLGRPDLTAQVLRDGWYVTGDIASEDEDGFLTITDRLHRFSKIGGEMVPHIRVEEMLHELAGVAERALVVTAIPDPARGERLAVLHVLEESQLRALLEKLAKANLPNLWKPKPDHFIRVADLPLLGSGKLDLRRAREIALRALAAA